MALLVITDIAVDDLTDKGQHVGMPQQQTKY
jgi:hypothetical protein